MISPCWGIVDTVFLRLAASKARADFGSVIRSLILKEVADNALATRRQADDDSQASAEKAQHPLDPCVEGRMRTGQREDAANHSSQGESNDCWSRRRFR